MIFFKFPTTFFTSEKEMWEGKMEFLERRNPTPFSLASFMRLHFPSHVHDFHFMTHSDNLLYLKLH